MVSVIITTCKRSPEIVKRAIISVVNQSYPNWELFLIDDSPEDFKYRQDVKMILADLSVNNNVEYVANEVNSGACFSRNVGLQMAKGEFVAFLDDDDEWLPEKIWTQVNALEKAAPNVALVYNPFYKKVEGKEKLELIKRPLRSGMLYEDLMRDGNMFGGMSVPLMRTKCVKDVGGFDIYMQSAQDMDLWLRITQKYEVISIDDPLVIYHVHSGEQITTSPEKKIAGLERLYEKNKGFLNKHKDIKWKRNFQLINYYLAMGRRKDAFMIWSKTVRICPMKVSNNMKELVHILKKTIEI